jgi:hypothetical protein
VSTPEPEQARLVDVGQVVTDRMRQLEAAGFEDEDAHGDRGGRLDPGDPGDGRL